MDGKYKEKCPGHLFMPEVRVQLATREQEPSGLEQPSENSGEGMAMSGPLFHVVWEAESNFRGVPDL